MRILNLTTGFDFFVIGLGHPITRTEKNLSLVKIMLSPSFKIRVF